MVRVCRCQLGRNVRRKGEVCVGGCGEGWGKGLGWVGGGGRDGGLTDLTLFLLWCNCLSRFFPPFFYISSFLLLKFP